MISAPSLSEGEKVDIMEALTSLGLPLRDSARSPLASHLKKRQERLHNFLVAHGLNVAVQPQSSRSSEA